jgi:hypothetical protein
MDLLIFIGATLTALFAVGYFMLVSQLEYIKDNWILYRCNPIYMPFAGMVGQDVGSNFMKCTMKSFQDYAGFILDPIQQMFATFLQMFGSITDSLQSMRQMFAGIRNGFLGIVTMIFGKLANTMAAMQYLMIRIRTVFMRIAGIMKGMLNIMNAGVNTGASVVNGPVGKTVSFLCFDGSTVIHTNRGKVPMDDIKLGDVIIGGHTVKAVYILNGFGCPLYDYKGILVTGNHRLANGVRVSDDPEAVLQYETRPVLYCFDTDTGQIRVGDVLFMDMEWASPENPLMEMPIDQVNSEKRTIVGFVQRTNDWEVIVHKM